VQECFLRAYRSLATFQAGAQVGSWLYRIAVNVCLDASRRRRRRPAVALDEREDLQPVEPHPVANPERRAVSRDLRQAIDRAVLDLSPLERAVFVLRHHQELPLKEIAALLGRPEGTVKSVLFRGLRKLQRRLAPLRTAS
jgi:RNA polymerase sigma-70 factor, ECF subfamily